MANGRVSLQQTHVYGVVASVERDTAAPLCPPHCRRLRVTRWEQATIRSGSPEAAQLDAGGVVSGRADGLLSIHTVMAASQPELCRSSSRLCRPCSHGQGQLLANKFSALNYAKPPLYH
jgi:hypothetical protein